MFSACSRIQTKKKDTLNNKDPKVEVPAPETPPPEELEDASFDEAEVTLKHLSPTAEDVMAIKSSLHTNKASHLHI